MHPKTFIVVLTYNGLDITTKFAQNLYSYTSNFQVLFIDNGSTDDTPKYLKSLENNENTKIILNNSNLGIIDGRNLGCDIFIKEHKDIDYILFLDNDQYVQKNWLEHHHDVMTEGNYDIIGVEAWQLNKSLFPIKKCSKLNEPFSYVGCGGMMIKRPVVEKIGLFDPQFNPCYFEDPDFNFRAIKENYKIGWNFNAKIFHLAHQTLGKDVKKIDKFKISLNKFKMKWYNKAPGMLIQKKINSFSKSYS